MNIERVELNNFRNYKELSISFDEGVNLILGDNAQGKTNLIEALYISSMGKSFRTKNDLELINFDSDSLFLRVFSKKDDINIEIEVEIQKKSQKNTIKKIKKNKKQLSKTSELINNILIVIFSPDDLKLVKDEPEKRRRFLDREMCQISPLYYENYQNYKRALKQRNNYIKEGNINYDLLDVWDEQLSEYGSQIIRLRNQFVKKLNEISKKIHSGITNNEEEIDIIYEPSIGIKENFSEQKEYFYNEIIKRRERDIENRITSLGPHRDDICFSVNGIDMRNYGSQGQQRTCALSLKLAELALIKEETNEDAILILDDVMSELDVKRQEFLIRTLSENQLFITSTDLDNKIIEKLDNVTIYSVKNGNVEIVR